MAGCAALVLAGGSGTRFGGETPKQYLMLGGRTLLRHAAEAFVAHPAIDHVRVVIREEDRDRYGAAVAGLRILDPAIGGPTRQDSARLGLESLVDFAPDLVLIHDGARPFVDAPLIDRTLAALTGAPAALPVLPVSDTIKRAAPGATMVAETVDRGGLWRAQTPQGFRFPEILAAHRAVAGAELTDDAMVAEHAGLAVAMVAGSEDNVKITSPEDLARAERTRTDARGITRVGSGFDVHRFCAGDHVMLCGVRVAHDHGLEGHSDADAGLHALTDAILGAIGEGDIGTFFPPSDPQWRGTESHVFLRHAAALVRDRGGAIANVDVTVICERPKIGPHREAMRARIAAILGMPVDAVAVKATTTEGLGFTGRGEGIAAQAIAAVRLPGCG
jgi:2-C-methyl-D-erythritol 4-phosphate cytidylyltransferase/2-C-methyl-D-erythritol 2,4-cyclodiphosphate synthase